MCFQVVIFYYKVSQELQTGHTECLVSTEKADVLTVLTCPSVVRSVVMSVMSVYISV